MLATLGRKFPHLKGSNAVWRIFAILLVVIGVTMGIFSAVRSCSILVAIGGAIYTYVAYTTSAKRRTIELLIPMGLSLLLFIVSLTLPHAK
ncbi:MAG: hypothetical protein WDN07_01210 [Actinomycetota bacterium]